MKFNVVARSSLAALLLTSLASAPGWADSPPAAPVSPHYADLADLADGTPLVVRVQPRKLVALDRARAQGVRARHARFYVEARTEALIAGQTALGGQLRYLVDLPLDAKGKPPAIKKKSQVIFARTVPERPGELQLVARDAQFAWDAALDARLRAVLAELYAPGAPQRITGVREAIHVEGDLAGEGETQLFLTTASGDPAAITVTRRPGQDPRWSVSFSELVAADAEPPAHDTLAWYRLACFLPARLPDGVKSAGTASDRAAAARDYAFVIEQLGPCPRIRD